MMAILRGLLAAPRQEEIPSELMRFALGEEGYQNLRGSIHERPAIPDLGVCWREYKEKGDRALNELLSAMMFSKTPPPSVRTSLCSTAVPQEEESVYAVVKIKSETCETNIYEDIQGRRATNGEEGGRSWYTMFRVLFCLPT